MKLLKIKFFAQGEKLPKNKTIVFNCTTGGRAIEAWSKLKDEKFDMIFMGQVVEHIQIAGLPVVFSWIKEHLQPNGIFCFDTPNRIITKVQMGDELYIDPDHKKEYTPAEIVTLMQENGFEVTQQHAILQMPNVQKNNSFDTEDYYDGQLVSDNPDEGYCFGTYAKVKIG